MAATLTAADRCDKCGAAAHISVELTAGPLLFCAHHARKYGFTDCLPRTTTAATSGTAGE